MGNTDISAEEREQFLKEYEEAVNAFRNFCVKYNLTSSGAYNMARRYEMMRTQSIQEKLSPEVVTLRVVR